MLKIMTFGRDKNEMSKAEIIKMAAGTLIGLGVETVVCMTLGRYLPAKRGWMRLLGMLGGVALGIKLGEDTEKYFYQVYDETKEFFDEAKKEMKEDGDEQQPGSP